MRKKRLLCLLLALGMLLSLLGCSGTAADADSNQIYDELADYYQQKNKDKDVSISSFALPYLQGLTLDPVTCGDGTQQDIGCLLYEGLVQLDLEMQPQAVLAQSWSYDAASYTWTIQLRSGVTFSDGSPLTARDVSVSLERARQSQRYAARLAEVSSVRAQGDTVVIAMNADLATLAWRLDIPIVKSGTEERTAPVGTGPYVFTKSDGGAYLALNADWWRGVSLPLQRIEL